MKDNEDNEIREKNRDRRKQVLDAAAKCFREEGFHGCSIARISKAAGMSPGHIYYHFANKEAIVEALVAQQENSLLELVNDIAASPPDENLADTLTRHTKKMVDHHTSADFVGLWLEMAAEATRNPGIARLLQLSDKTISAKFDQQLAARGKAATAEQLRQLRIGMEMIATIFNGLSARAYTRAEENGSDKALLVETINGIIAHLFTRR
ncbi:MULTISPECIES: TetR/AcrR family transcriptional regulator [Brenneria]|uniref:TetR/AcrR family transcriptional regulator n=1 Tax=Brenneria nigrifluens DSM 30175 = ATCC 13028 TaxID=1121120 RepID=A0A2U1UR17_9GAMM|nr:MULTISPECIES: TetR/AcrR family transcriptional regulator [Brenneria]EHD22314.1 transcriptional regulator, TetR family [Brenneria sp. EniD312]PWC24138.1 TetR/AcrR family transcriptional regulator [Brenneria nigrifluens DSM 30175 = ATCC 13028]QCR05330.1 TetR/AcrR family transcriptional regulator [Brenneria nigrifluens DSM 30175 = ATCC 13028]